MRVFTSEVKDDVTRYSMVLSGVSFNHAMDWLQRTLHKYGAEVRRVEGVPGSGILTIHTGPEDNIWEPELRRFFYDEDRGYLLGE